MVTSGLPRNNVPPRCIPPDGLIHGSEGLTGIEAVKAGHDEEEECLLFVALSRARDRLQLYAYATQADGRARSPSKFVAPDRPTSCSSGPGTAASRLDIDGRAARHEMARAPQWTDIQVNLFERCPGRFVYTHVLRLGGRRTETAFMKMHNVVSDVFEWLKRNTRRQAPRSTNCQRASRRHGAPRARQSMDRGKTTAASVSGSSTSSSRAAAVAWPRQRLRSLWGGPRARSL